MFKSERGIALVVALIIMVAIMGLASAYLLLTISESRRAKVDEYYLRRLHTADGGIQQGIWRYEDVAAFKEAVKNDGDTWFVITLPDGGVDTVVVTK
ncbi:MAG: hypothetical protein AB1797_03560 [bacterium]